MRKLLAFICVAALGWAVYWFIGAQGHERALAQWLDDRRAEGWQVEYSDHSVRGFPNRFDTTFTDLSLTDPETGLSWQAPFFQILSLSYKPNHLIAVWPNEQVIATPREKFNVTTDTMRASFKVKPSRTLALDSANIEMAQAVIASSDGWTAGFDALNAAIRNTPDTGSTYDVAASIDQFLPGERVRRLIDQGGTLPDEIETLRFDLQAALAAPLDRIALETNRPDITAITLRELRGLWGRLELRLTGDVTVSDALPDGDVAITARNWRDMLALAVDAGAMDADLKPTIELGLGLLARSSGNEDALDATISFSGGRSFLGPIPIGPAPRLQLP